MARGFTDDEKEVIKTALLVEGKKLFGNFGLKKTNIAQLTAAAGISPATFYQFFQSKEDLYFAIFQAESEKVQASLLEHSSKQKHHSGASVIENLLLASSSKIKSDPFIKQVTIGNDLEYVLGTRSQEEINNHVTSDYEQFLPYIQALQKEGKVIDTDPKVLTAIIQMFFVLHQQQDKFGPEVFDSSIELLAKWIGQGFSKETEE